MLKKGLCLLIGIMMLFCQINVVHATNLASGAESAILIDAQSQQVLYQKNANKKTRLFLALINFFFQT